MAAITVMLWLLSVQQVV